MKSEISAMKKMQKDETKDKRIERALKLGLVHVGSFTYFEVEEDGEYERFSDVVAQSALEWFLLGRGRYIDGMTLENCYNRDQTKKDASAQAFRDKFKDQIKALIGKEPRVEKFNGKWVIFYE